MKEDNDIVTIPPSARRRAELAELEREIGRAMIGMRLIESQLDMAERAAFEVEHYRDTTEWKAAETLGACESKVGERIDELIARWRKLHREGETK